MNIEERADIIIGDCLLKGEIDKEALMQAIDPEDKEQLMGLLGYFIGATVALFIIQADITNSNPFVVWNEYRKAN